MKFDYLLPPPDKPTKPVTEKEIVKFLESREKVNEKSGKYTQWKVKFSDGNEAWVYKAWTPKELSLIQQAQFASESIEEVRVLFLCRVLISILV